MVDLFDWQSEVYIERNEKFIIVPAGRRTGKTQGAAIACIIHASQGKQCLWVDTTHSNIDRYFERYFLPLLKSEDVPHKWNVQKKLLNIGDGYIDFRSADRPENIEGFGYHHIFLNEAGIILNNDYLYTNAILPMMLDFEDSQLIAFGTPKGKVNKFGEKHKFFSLWENCLNGDNNYFGRQLSTYDNPFITEQNIQELEEEIRKENPDAIPQEIYAEFMDTVEGVLFNSSELHFYDSRDYKSDAIRHRLGYIDVAAGGQDSTCFVYGEVQDNGDVYITDVIMSNEESTFTIPACKDLADRKKPQYVQVETNAGGKIFYTELHRKVKSCAFIPLHNTSNKETRIISNSWFVKKYVYFRKDYATGSDYDKFMKELLSFNKSKKKNKHDDAPDALTGLTNFIYEYLNKLYL